MGTFAVRNLPDDLHQKLRLIAKKNERSVEAEARQIIKTAVESHLGDGLGQQLKSRWVGCKEAVDIADRDQKAPSEDLFE